MILSCFLYILGYFDVQWPVVFGYLALQVYPRNEQPSPNGMILNNVQLLKVTLQTGFRPYESKDPTA